jgi:cytoskeletal protein RodZ
MRDDQDALSFGRYLQAIRLEKKISLEQVAKQTRIGLGTLQLLEQEDYDQLPAEVYVKGFLRAYAAAVGADGDEAVRRYESRVGVVQKITESAAAGKPETRLWWKLIACLVLLLCIIALSVLVISFFPLTPGPEESPRPTSPAAEEQPVAGEAQPGVGLPPEAEKAAAGKLSLQITALENTWVKVIIDEKASTEYNLVAGDDVELEAATGYNLLIGNAGGIKISFNDKPVAIPGESGQVVTMHLP